MKEPYVHAIMAAQQDLERFEEHGHGTFLWRAYLSARAAAEDFPAYRADVLRLFEELESCKGNLALAARAEELEAERNTLGIFWSRNHDGDPVTDKFLREVTERILRHIDAMADDLLKVTGASSPEGAASLRKALRMNDQLNPTSAAARVSEETIIHKFWMHLRYQRLFQRGRRYGESAPPAVWNFTQLRNYVAADCGVSGQHAGGVIRRYLKSAPWEQELLDEVLAAGRTLKPKRPTKAATRKQKRRPAKPAAWRK